MPLEIERKFLLTGDPRAEATTSMRICQGYLNSAPERTVRVRIQDNRGFLTIKGLGSDSGASRYEWEHAINVDEAHELLKLCEPGVIDKTRYFVDFKGHVFEIDYFNGDNEGLVLAEVELETENEEVELPSWIGQEVTGELKYYNSSLVKNPYTLW
jgi:adenylate cyclase